MSTYARGLVILSLLLLSASASWTSQDKDKKDKQDPAQQAEIRALITSVDDVMAGKPGANTLPLKWEQEHFIKAQANKTYIPFTLAIDPPAFTTTTPVGVYLRVVKKGQAPPTAPPAADKDKKGEKGAAPPSQYSFEDIFFLDATPPAAGQPQRIRRAFAVEPGEYEVFAAVKEKAGATAPAATPATTPTSGDAAAATGPKLGVLEHDLSVPSLEGTDLTTSSVIIAEKVDVLQTPVPTERQADNPYTFGPMKITPSRGNKFTKKDDLNVIFWIYGAATDPATKKPNVTVDFSFSQKLADGEKYFNKTDPQEMNAATLPPEFDLAAGHQLPGSLQVPLASFPEGEYHLQVKIADKVSGKSITRDVNFTVAAQ
jgi:hypothetical protein